MSSAGDLRTQSRPRPSSDHCDAASALALRVASDTLIVSVEIGEDRVRRREFITLLGVGAFYRSYPASAQSAAASREAGTVNEIIE